MTSPGLKYYVTYLTFPWGTDAGEAAKVELPHGHRVVNAIGSKTTMAGTIMVQVLVEVFG